MQEKTARSAVAPAGIGISPARRSLAKGGYQMGHWLESQRRSTQDRQSQSFRGLAAD
jgi:hypothetical protein